MNQTYFALAFIDGSGFSNIEDNLDSGHDGPSLFETRARAEQYKLWDMEVVEVKITVVSSTEGLEERSS